MAKDLRCAVRSGSCDRVECAARFFKDSFADPEVCNLHPPSSKFWSFLDHEDILDLLVTFRKKSVIPVALYRDA